MTNKEKIDELLPSLGPTMVCLEMGIKEKLQKMAEWKDGEFKSLLPEIFDWFNEQLGLYDGGISREEQDKKWFIQTFEKKIDKLW